MSKESVAYKALCTEFYDLDKPTSPEDALQCYLRYAKEAQGPILEPMCGTGRFLIPLVEKGYIVTGFDYSSHMLNVCRKKCNQRGLTVDLFEASFETFQFHSAYNLIFIPSGSFGHLITSEQVSQALTFIAGSLNSGGKFVFEVETLKTIREPQGVWRGRWVSKPDRSKIVLNVLSQFDSTSRIETGLFRYELWEENVISQTEVEEYHVRHYEPAEIEQLLKEHGLKVIDKWQAEPYSGLKASDKDAVILYECVKS
jgi:SAM-dependent methyltransferase